MKKIDFSINLRTMDLFKLPGMAETIDWSKALLKYQDDIGRIKGSEIERLLAEVRAELTAK